MDKKRLTSGVKTVVLLITLVLAFGILRRSATPENLATAFTSFDASSVFLAVLLLILNLVAGAARFDSILKTFGQRLQFPTVLHASLMGNIGSVFLFQVVGQTLSRWQVLKTKGLSASFVITVTLYERVITALAIFGLGLVGAIHLYGVLNISYVNVRVLEKALIVLFGSLLVVSWVVVKPYTKRVIKNIAWSGHLRDVLKDIGWAVVVNGFMAAAYVVLIAPRAPQVSWLSLWAAAAVVMVAASIPISVSGWGVRELSAVLAFQQVGVAEADAIAVSVAVGLLSLLVLLVLGGMNLLYQRVHKDEGQVGVADAVMKSRSSQWRATVLKMLPFATAFFMLFSVRVPFGASEITLNLADPIALMGTVILGVWFFRNKKQHLAMYRSELSPVFVLAGVTAFVMAYGLFVGSLNHGLSNWALFNRGLGTVVILSLLVTGYWAGRMNVAEVKDLIPKTVVWALATILSFDLFFVVLKALDVQYFAAAASPNALRGEAANSNAFGFQLILGVLCLFFLYAQSGKDTLDRMLRSTAWVLPFLFIGIWLSKSRTTWVVIFIAAMTALVLRQVKPKALVASVTAVLVGLGMQTFLADVPPFDRVLKAHVFVQPLFREGSELERMKSISEGLEFFYGHPVWGGGIGAFIQKQIKDSGQALVIHSTPIWLLAETGLIGFGLILGCFIWLLWLFYTRFQQDRKPIAAFGFLLLISFGVFSLPHDIFFQRAAWFFLGFCLAGVARRWEPA